MPLPRLLQRLLGRPTANFAPAHTGLDAEYKPLMVAGAYKQLEALLLQHIATGRLTFKHASSNRVTHRQEDWRARQADVWYEVDYPNAMVGTFSYFRVCGVDLSNKPPEEFDGQRLMRCVRTGTDPGPQPANQGLVWL